MIMLKKKLVRKGNTIIEYTEKKMYTKGGRILKKPYKIYIETGRRKIRKI